MREDAWLAGVLGRPAFAVAGRPGAAPEAAAAVASAPGAFAWARVPVRATAVVEEMCDAGFRPVDVAVTLARAPEPVPPGPRIRVVPARPEHRDAVAAVAAEAFTLTRFHLDPHVDDALAAAVKREWAGNCVDGGRGVGTLVALGIDGSVEGFVAAIAGEHEGRPTRVIDLIAVRPDRQGRGVGGALVDAFVRGHGPDADTLLVGTQAANAASLRLYEGRGFRTVGAAYVLHLHGAPR